MTKEITISAAEVSFKDFLFKNKRNPTILCIAAAAIVIQFSIFKYYYPYASFIHGDSFVYIETAQKNLDINTYMVGYSRFLRLFSVFTTSDTALVAFQYLLIQSSILFLLFTIFYFYKPAILVQNILLVFMLFNPLFLYLGNLISSDCIFSAFSLFWFTSLLWIIHRPTTIIISWQILTLFISFTFRYNAMIYPLIASIVLIFSPTEMRIRIASISIGLLICSLFVFYTSYKYKKLTGYLQYSPFSGWQLSNNAMYAYRYVQAANRKPVPEKFRPLDNMIREYFDSTRDIKKHPIESLQASTVYMWTKRLTLYKYRDQLFNTNDSSASEFKRWASMGPFYKDYGLFIIQKYPWHFARYFLWPNAKKYYAPPVEFLEKYNGGNNKVALIAKEWFKYKSPNVSTRTKDKEIILLNFFPILSGVINVVMLLGLLFFSSLKGWQEKSPFRKGILLGCAMWLFNACFTIFASSAALRFQAFPILLSSVFAALFMNWLWKMAMSPELPIRDTKINYIEDTLSIKILN